MPSRIQAPRPDPATAEVGFDFQGSIVEQPFDLGTPEFVWWQCREAALAALERAGALGATFPIWARSWPGPTRLQVIPNAGVDLNAYYDGQSLRFFQFGPVGGVGGDTIRAAASTDVVAHETGHAILDALRPDLWDVPAIEVAAFHESFADCMAIETALGDGPTREYLVAHIDEPNAVEALAEELAFAVQQTFGPLHPAAEPRHALNLFAWRPPASLPASGPPARLTSEFHSFSRVFTGCFYDLVRNLFHAAPRADDDALATAARVAGTLLIAAVRSTPVSNRFFHAVGAGLLRADQQANQGANMALIRSALESHGLAPESAMTLMIPPRSPKELVASVPSETGRPRRVEVDLSDLDPRLAGCVAMTMATLPPSVQGNCLPEIDTSADEVRAFVNTLLAHDRIDFPNPEYRAAVEMPLPPGRTHAVHERNGKKVLMRVRFT